MNNMDMQTPKVPGEQNAKQRNMMIAAAVGVIIIIIAAILVTRDFKSAAQDAPKPSIAVGEPNPSMPKPEGFEEPMCGFVVAAKPEWSIDYNKGGGLSIVMGAKEVTVVCAEEIPGIPVSPEQIVDTQIDGVAAKLYHDASPKDGTLQDDIRVKHPTTGVDVTVRGTPGFVAEVGATLKWIR